MAPQVPVISRVVRRFEGEHAVLAAESTMNTCHGDTMQVAYILALVDSGLVDS